MTGKTNPLSKKDLDLLKNAANILENPSLTSKITDVIGMPIEKAFENLPAKWADKVGDATHIALKKSLYLSISSMDLNYSGSPSNSLHKVLVGITGGVGGALGLPALSIELPVTTTIMLRSIADVARSEGEDLTDLETRLSCLEVFALGGKSKDDDSSETGYYAVRATLAKSISEAAKFVTENGLTEEGAPILIKFITKIATRFGIEVSEKAAAQAVPLIGAAGGIIINVLFMDHFQNMARGHFTIKRLEKKYDPKLIEAEYNKIKGNH